MRRHIMTTAAGLALATGAATAQDAAPAAPMGDASRSDQEYVWISNASNLPLFVEKVYPGLDAAAAALNVNIRIAGPTSIDLAAFIATVDAECAQGPDGVMIVGGWDDALASEVDKCVERGVPTVVVDGDLPMSSRLAYVGTNWYNLGYAHGEYQCRFHEEAGLSEGQIGTISFLASTNFAQARQGIRDALAANCPGVTVVADEESGSNVEQVAAVTSALVQGNPSLTGMVGLDSEAGPGIVRAVAESGRQHHRDLQRCRSRVPRNAQGRQRPDDQLGEVRDDGLRGDGVPVLLQQRHGPQLRPRSVRGEPAAADDRLGPRVRYCRERGHDHRRPGAGRPEGGQ